MHYDVFNGDADGIIALLQLRWFEPKQSQLITGVKRDIQLLQQVTTAGDATSVTVLDISMEKNSRDLHTLLSQCIDVFYCDHHRTGDIPNSKYLNAVIDLNAEICTSLLINNYLDHQYIHWAIVAAFGDNLNAIASTLAVECGINQLDAEFLKELGTLINYNSYGASLSDLHIEPAVLYQQLLMYPNPFSLREDEFSPYYLLKEGYAKDRKHTDELKPVYESVSSRIYELPSEPWARRISGVFGNELANQRPDLAHAVLTLNSGRLDYTVSVRAPLNNRMGADEVCCQFLTGGGRKAAAGINALSLDDKILFIEVLNRFYQ